jgi:PAS domain S-box-containing protein
MKLFLLPDPESATGVTPKEWLYYKMIDEVEDYAILMLDRDGHVVNWNKGAEKIKGYTEKEILSKHFRIFYPPQDQENHLPEMLLKQGATYGKATHEGWRVRKDGTRFWGSIVITAIHNSSNEVIGFTKVTRDLTQRKIAEDQLKEQAEQLSIKNQELLKANKQIEESLRKISEANKELEKFAFIASHDLQEPVRKIATFFSRLCSLNEGSFNEQSHILKDKIITSTNRMNQLINNLLALSNLSEKAALAPVDLNEVINYVLEDLEIKIEESGAQIKLQVLPVVMGVTPYLQQLFFNLIGNSLKFTQEVPVVEISSKTNGNKVRVYIKDNGIGIDKEYQNQIFETFRRLHARTDYEGSGLGLSICKRIIDIHEGEIEVESEPGNGTTFTVTLLKADE